MASQEYLLHGTAEVCIYSRFLIEENSLIHQLLSWHCSDFQVITTSLSRLQLSDMSDWSASSLNVFKIPTVFVLKLLLTLAVRGVSASRVL